MQRCIESCLDHAETVSVRRRSYFRIRGGDGHHDLPTETWPPLLGLTTRGFHNSCIVNLERMFRRKRQNAHEKKVRESFFDCAVGKVLLFFELRKKFYRSV